MVTDKVKNLRQLDKICKTARANGRRVVWTNGCYDLVHAGHVIYLQSARACGDILVVGLNSDASVQKTKGPLRPIVSEANRARVMSALECVDYVIVFDDVSPVKTIEFLKPDVYAKGGDYNIDTINQEERHLVEGYGGDIALLPGVAGLSTTAIIEKILEVYGAG